MTSFFTARLAAVTAAAVFAFGASAQADHAQPADAAHTAAQDAHADDHAGGAHQADHGDHGGHEKVGALPSIQQGLATGVTALVVFAIVAGVLGAGVWPKISRALDEREQKILGEIEAAEAARKQARSALEQYEKSLAEARAEAQSMLEQTKADQMKLAAELRARSEADLHSMKEKAQRDIDAARRAAVADLYAQASDLATAVAGKILQREVNAGDQQRLIEEAVAELGAARRN
jgi:F-type H+-transporting ATPase subunit b